MENNQYGMGTHVKRSSANPEMLYKFADLYNMPSTKIDGMDVVTVRDSAREAIDKIRNESGPILIEAMTYRFRGHSMADPSEYRENEEVQQWQKEKDPIELFKQHCFTNNILSKEEAELINKEYNAGTYKVTWDASSFASGVYFTELISGSKRQTQKIILLK